ncbi:MAG TPA: alpha/beta hydrolase [Pseudolysinimonas sp.]|nr:alpha/beta hydrolase [Pseudolysinimonas sp.]
MRDERKAASTMSTFPAIPLDPQGETEPDYIDVNGVKTAYRRSGSGEPLVFIHGMGLANSWLSSEAKLAEHFDVIAPQLPGFGKTARPAWYRTLDDFVVHLADVLNAFGLDKVHLVGHSLGGITVGAFAATYPERIASLTVVAPLPLPVVIAPELVGTHDGPAPANLMEMLFNETWEQYPHLETAGDLGLFISEADDDFSDPEKFSLEPSAGLYRRLDRITAPRQVIVPDHDYVAPEPTGTDWAHWLKAPLVKISGTGGATTGHMLTEQEPDAYVAAIVALAEQAK